MGTVYVNQDGSADYQNIGDAVQGISQKVIDGEISGVGAWDIICQNCISLEDLNNPNWNQFDPDDPPEGFYVEPVGGHHINFNPVTSKPALALSNLVLVLTDDVDVSSSIRLADIQIIDDSVGSETIYVGGPDAASFEIKNGDELHLKAGVDLDHFVKSQYQVTVFVNDQSIDGSTPEHYVDFFLGIEVNYAESGITDVIEADPLGFNTAEAKIWTSHREAEDATPNVDGWSHTWDLVTSGTANDGAVENHRRSMPEHVGLGGGVPTSHNARLDFRFRFRKRPDQYRVWARVWKDDRNDDEFKWGLDGTFISDKVIPNPDDAWTWMNLGGITVDGADDYEDHTVNIWSRDGGLRIDRVVVVSSPSSATPSGQGPVYHLETNDEVPPQDPVYGPSPRTEIALRFNIIGSSQLLNRSAIWIRDSAINFYGLKLGQNEVVISWKDMIFYSLDGGTLVNAEDGVILEIADCNAVGSGTLCHLIDGQIDINRLHPTTVHGGNGWHVFLDGSQHFSLVSGDYDTHALKVRRALLGFVRTGKPTDIQDCLAPNEGMDGYEETGLVGGHWARRGHYVIGNILDRVRFHPRMRFNAEALRLRHGGIYRRLYIPGGAQPDSQHDPRASRAPVLGQDFWPHTSAIRVSSFGWRYFVIEKCQITGWYRGINIEMDGSWNADRVHGQVYALGNYFKWVDQGMESNAINTRRSGDNNQPLNGIEMRDNRQFPGGWGNTCVGTNMLNQNTYNPSNQTVSMSCNNGSIRTNPSNCFSGGVSSPGSGNPPPSGGEGESSCPNDQAAQEEQPCDQALLFLGSATEQPTYMDLSSIQNEGLNHPGCTAYRLVQWNGDPAANVGGQPMHLYTDGAVRPDGTMENLPQILEIRTVYSGHIFLQFRACEPDSFSEGGSNFFVLPRDYSIPEDGIGLLPPEAIDPPYNPK